MNHTALRYPHFALENTYQFKGGNDIRNKIVPSENVYDTQGTKIKNLY